jgi:hypothetical protein
MWRALARSILEARELRRELEMETGTMMAASTSWPDAAIAIAGVALVASVAVVVVWQALATWRARIAVSREQAYRELAEQTARDVREIKERLDERERVAAEGER